MRHFATERTILTMLIDPILAPFHRRLPGRKRTSTLTPPAQEQLPPTVGLELDRSVRDLWADRALQVVQDHYAGVPMWKFPEDLRVYEHLLWASCPTVVIELGASGGGSALWFRDRLRTLVSYGRVRDPIRVVSVDIQLDDARQWLAAADPSYAETIVLLEADVRDPTLAAAVDRCLPPAARCLVVEDSAHLYETTRAALEGFARFVPSGGFFVVEDGCVDVDDMRAAADWPRGVLPAVRDWLAGDEGSCFTVRRDLEMYGLTCHPQGYLQRTTPRADPTLG